MERMLRVCCVCHFVYGCYEGNFLKDCVLCGEHCLTASIYNQKPVELKRLTEASHGFCEEDFQIKMEELEERRKL
jgi:hypothetical protein